MNQDLSSVLDLASDIGKLLLSNGAETYRVEDTVYRVISHYGGENVNVYAVPNCIIISAEDKDSRVYNRLLRVTERNTHLGKVRRGNELSRQITGKNLSVTEAYELLQDIQMSQGDYTQTLHHLAASALCAMFTILYNNGSFDNVLAGLICGFAAFFAFNYLNKLTNIQFFSEMGSGFVAGWVAFFLVSVSIGNNMNIIILSSVMPMVPGRAITTGFRDLMASDYVSGVSILADAMLTAGAIGIGVAGVLAIV